MKKEGREKLYKAFLADAYPDRKKKVVTTKELMRGLGKWTA